MKLIFGFLFALLASPIFGQQVTVSATVQDSDGQLWVGGSYQVTLVRPGGLPNFYCTYTGTNFPASFGGTLDGTGSFSVQLTTTACIVPTGSLWQFQICPDVTGAACGVIQIPVTTSGSISSKINAVILAPRVTGGPGIHAYNDTEVAAFSPNQYFNVISQQNRCYSTSWAVCAGGGSGLPAATAAGQAPVSTGPGTTYTAQPILASTTYTAGVGGVTANTLVMGDGAGNVIPFVNTSGNYGLYSGVATSTAAAISTTTVANSSGQLAACQFDGTPVVGDIVVGSTSTPGDCHDQGTTNQNTVAPYEPIVGWVQSVAGTVGTVRLAGLGVWGAGNLVVTNNLNAQVLYGALTLPSTNTAKLGTIFYADGFSTTNNFTGIGVAQTAWSAGSYRQCTAVSYSGSNYLSTTYLTSATPGTTSSQWYPVPNANTPTALDCAFYTAAASIITGTGTVTNGNPATIILGSGTYGTNIGLLEPTVSTPGNPVVNILGQGSSNSIIVQTASISNATLKQPMTLTSYAFATFQWRGFEINSNLNAPAVMETYGAQGFIQDDLFLEDAAEGSDHYVEWGNSSDTPHGWDFEPDIEHVNLTRGYGVGSGAYGACTVSGGVPTCTVTNGGANYTSGDTQVILAGTSDFGRPCSSIGTTTATIASGVVTAITTSATGCVAPVYPIIYGGVDINYGFKFSNVSDRGRISSLTNGGIGWIAGMYISNAVNAITIDNYHPESTLRGVQNYGGVTFNSLQCDTIFQYCFDQEGGGAVVNVNNPFFEWNNVNMTASRDYYFSPINGVPGYSAPGAFNITGEMCGGQAQQPGYAHFDTSSGVVDSSVGSDTGFLPAWVNDANPQYCNNFSISNPTPNPSMATTDFSFGNGVATNQWNFNVGTAHLSSGGAGAQALNLTQVNSTAAASIGRYLFNFQNPTASTSGQNYSSPLVGIAGTYWNGSASTPFGINQQLTFASGSNPLATYSFNQTGTAPTGGVQVTFPGSTVVLPNGSTATTQTTGDNSTKVATDAFVLANAGSGTTTNSLTLNNSGSGAASGSTFNGSSAITLSYNTLGAAPLASPALTGTPTAPTATAGTNTTQIATTAFVQTATGGGGATLGANTFTGTQTAPAFNLQAKAAGPYASYFNDFFNAADITSTGIGSPTGQTCNSTNGTFQDQNHPGTIVLLSGTGGSGTGIVCLVGTTASQAPQITTAGSSLPWTWESAVYVPVLPATTSGAYQAGMTNTIAASPWTTGIGFYLAAANGVPNDWYCEYGSTYTDSTVAATVAWTRLTMANDGTLVHWYIGGTEVCGTGVAIASVPSSVQAPAWTSVGGTATAMKFAVDYVNFQRAVTR